MTDAMPWHEALRDTVTGYRRMIDAVLSQLSDDELRARPRADLNSVAVLLRHLGGNLQSRWTSFRTEDGEKPSRDRDREFEDWPGSRAELMAVFEEGWNCLVAAIADLDATDPDRTVLIRGERHTVAQAMLRSIAHVSYHVGQILIVARLAHDDREPWQWLTIPPGGSRDHDAKTWGTAASRSVLGTAPDWTLVPISAPHIDVFHAHQSDAAAVRLAAFVEPVPQDIAAFRARWEHRLDDPAIIGRTIEVGGRAAGHVMCFPCQGRREITYWLGREYWGRGLATAAVRRFLALCPERPLHARVAADNAGSRRVLEKCGFEQCGSARGYAAARGEEIDEIVFRLDGRPA